jgi:hypothetical protein
MNGSRFLSVPCPDATPTARRRRPAKTSVRRVCGAAGGPFLRECAGVCGRVCGMVVCPYHRWLRAISHPHTECAGVCGECAEWREVCRLVECAECAPPLRGAHPARSSGTRFPPTALRWVDGEGRLHGVMWEARYGCRLHGVRDPFMGSRNSQNPPPLQRRTMRSMR